jgi:hypothetical protein
MDILISNTFIKDFNKIIKLNDWLNSFLLELKKIEKNIIKLSNNLFKYKFYVWNLSIRWVLILEISDKNIHIPCLIFKKSDKNYWNNLILTKEIEKLIDIQSCKIFKDIQIWSYWIYIVDDNYNIKLLNK